MAEINRRVTSMCSGLCRARALHTTQGAAEERKDWSGHMPYVYINYCYPVSEGASIGRVSITHEMFFSYAEMWPEAATALRSSACGTHRCKLQSPVRALRSQKAILKRNFSQHLTHSHGRTPTLPSYFLLPKVLNPTFTWGHDYPRSLTWGGLEQTGLHFRSFFLPGCSDLAERLAA